MNKLKIKVPKAKIAEFCKRWNISEFAIFGSALRVILLEDGETIHNAFFDRDFKE